MVVSSESRQYELLIHSLTHEHTKDNIDRHVLLFNKWCRDFSDGFFIRDLEYIIQLFEILRDRVVNHNELFRPIVESVLIISSKPLFECKANERLKSQSIELMSRYYYELTLFWNITINASINDTENLTIEDIKLYEQITQCFSCIININANSLTSNSNSNSNKQPMVDQSIIHNLLRDSKALDVIILKFLDVVSLHANTYDIYMNLSSDNQASKRGSLSDNQIDISKVDNYDNIKSKYHIIKEYMYNMLELCKELLVDKQTSAEMCLLGVNDGVVSILYHILLSDNSLYDSHLSICINILWNTIDNYLSINHLNHYLLSNNISNPLDTNQNYYDSLKQSLEEHSQNILHFENTVITLKNILILLLQSGYRLIDKENRNNIMVIFILLSTFPQVITSFITTGLLDIFITCSCICEISLNSLSSTNATSHNNDSNNFWAYFTPKNIKIRNFNTNSDIDIEFKRLNWLLISNLMSHDDVDILSCVGNSPLIYNMLLYIEYDVNNKHPQKLDIKLDDKYASKLDSKINIDDKIIGSKLDSKIYSIIDSKINGSSTISQQNVNNQSTTVSNPLTTTKPNNNPKIIKSKLKNDYFQSLPSSQFHQLQLQAIVFLVKNCIKILNEFLRLNGPIKILQLIELYVANHHVEVNSYLDNSMNSVSMNQSQTLIELENEYKQIIYYCILLLNKCLIISNIKVRKILCFGITNNLSSDLPNDVTIDYNKIDNNMISKTKTIDILIKLYQVLYDNDNIKSNILKLISLLCINTLDNKSSNLTTNSVDNPTSNLSMNLSNHSINNTYYKSYNNIIQISNYITNVFQNELRLSSGILLLIDTMKTYINTKPNVTIGVTSGKYINSNNNKTTNNQTINITNNSANSLISPEIIQNEIDNINVLIISLLDCINNCIINNPLNENYYVIHEGFDNLLDLYETSTTICLRIYILKCIYNFLNKSDNDNNNLVIYIKLYISLKSSRNFYQLLCHNWYDEEIRIYNYINTSGIICNLFDPLNNQKFPEFNNILESISNTISLSQESLSTNSLSEVKTFSNITNKLSNAITLANQINSSNHTSSYINESIIQIIQQVLVVDMRGIIANIFHLLNVFDDLVISSTSPINSTTDLFTSLHNYKSNNLTSSQNNLTVSIKEKVNNIINNTTNNSINPIDMLNPLEKQILVLSKYYNILNQSTIWCNIENQTNNYLSNYLSNKSLQCIESDKYMIEMNKDIIFTSSLTTLLLQYILYNDHLSSHNQNELELYQRILTKRNQQIKSLWLKKHSKYNKNKKY